MAFAGFTVIIECYLNSNDLTPTRYEFDYVDDVSVDTSSTITTYPLVSGDIVGDHIYRNPISMRISGRFSLTGNKRTEFDSTQNRLQNIQRTFEKIKNEGLFCTIYKVAKVINDDGSTLFDTSSNRFLARNNMVLHSISWTEHINSVNFSFSFQEVLLADIVNVDYTPDPNDKYLPALTEPTTVNVTETILDMTEVDQIVVNTLLHYHLIETTTLEAMQNVGKTLAASAIATTALSVAGIAVLTAIFGAASIPVVGWIAAGVIAVVGGIIVGIIALKNNIEKQNAEREFGIKAFEKYEDDRQMEAETIRFCNYVGTIHQSLDVLNNAIQTYKIPENDDGSIDNQEMMINIDDAYYIFTFTKNNASQQTNLRITNAVSNKEMYTGYAKGIADLSQCTQTNQLFRTETAGFFVYLMQADESDKKYEGSYIIVTQLDMTRFNDLLAELVANGMKR